MPPPNATDILVARAQQDVREIQRVRDCIHDARVTAIAGTPMIDRLNILLDMGGRALETLTGEASGGTEAWEALESARTWNSRVKRESLALVLGALLRDAGLDGGVGQVADRMLRGLSDRTGIANQVITSVGDSEFLDRTIELARTRFPDATVWGLPILGHELGHYVARVLPNADPQLRGHVWPLEALLSEEADLDADVLGGHNDDTPDRVRTRAAAHVGEIFADVYATYALGASHPLAAIVLRARVGRSKANNPTTFSNTHPSWARRVTSMCAALRAMSSMTQEPRHRLLAQQVEGLWSRVAGVAGGQDPLIRHAEPQATRMVEALVEHAPQRLRHGDEGQSSRLHALLAGRAQLTRGMVPAGSTLPHVLDAAWQWRMNNWLAGSEALAWVSQRALLLCAVVDP